MHGKLCKSKNLYAKLLVLLPIIWPMIFLPLLKSLIGIENHILWKAACFQMHQHFIFITWLIFKVIKCFIETFDYSVRTQQIFLIDRPFIKGFSYIYLWLLDNLCFGHQEILFDKYVHQPPQTLYGLLSKHAFLKCGICSLITLNKLWIMELYCLKGKGIPTF